MAKFGGLIASHVAEHMPNLIGFFVAAELYAG
jgi:hypothetical protein